MVVQESRESRFSRLLLNIHDCAAGAGRPRRQPADSGAWDQSCSRADGINCLLRSEEHTSELQSQFHLVCRLLLEKKKKKNNNTHNTTPPTFQLLFFTTS